MPKEDDLSPEHLGWLLDSRIKNQQASLRLFNATKAHPKRIKGRKNSLAAQALVSAAFSLWRSAFLADKTGDRGKSLADAQVFLGKMLVDNAIAYAQDKASREWTFNYYVSNANYRLKTLANEWPDIFPKKKGSTPKERWSYNQTAFEKAVEYFEDRLSTEALRK